MKEAWEVGNTKYIKHVTVIKKIFLNNLKNDSTDEGGI